MITTFPPDIINESFIIEPFFEKYVNDSNSYVKLSSISELPIMEQSFQKREKRINELANVAERLAERLTWLSNSTKKSIQKENQFEMGMNNKNNNNNNNDDDDNNDYDNNNNEDDDNNDYDNNNNDDDNINGDDDVIINDNDSEQNGLEYHNLLNQYDEYNNPDNTSNNQLFKEIIPTIIQLEAVIMIQKLYRGFKVRKQLRILGLDFQRNHQTYSKIFKNGEELKPQTSPIQYLKPSKLKQWKKEEKEKEEEGEKDYDDDFEEIESEMNQSLEKMNSNIVHSTYGTDFRNARQIRDEWENDHSLDFVDPISDQLSVVNFFAKNLLESAFEKERKIQQDKKPLEYTRKDLNLEEDKVSINSGKEEYVTIIPRIHDYHKEYTIIPRIHDSHKESKEEYTSTISRIYDSHKEYFLNNNY